jgi:hypothetical protein
MLPLGDKLARMIQECQPPGKHFFSQWRIPFGLIHSESHRPDLSLCTRRPSLFFG